MDEWNVERWESYPPSVRNQQVDPSVAIAFLTGEIDELTLLSAPVAGSDTNTEHATRAFSRN